MKKYSKPGLATAVKSKLPKQKFELSSKQIQMLKTSAHIVLGVAAVTGALAVAIVAPNIFKIMSRSSRYKSFSVKQRERQITKSFYYLKRKGYIEWDRTGQELLLHITQKGKNKVAQLNFQTMMVSPSKKWDGQWWLVLADVPQESRRQEDMLRRKLKEMNFYPFQRSVWIYPYSPRTEVEIVSKFYQIERFVTTMRIDEVEKPDRAALLEFFRKKNIL
jgi:hypothetical protein